MLGLAVVILIEGLILGVLLHQGKGMLYEMDWGGPGNFVYLQMIYNSYYKLLAIIALTEAFATGFYELRDASVFLFFASCNAFIFPIFLNYSYEEYCHQRWAENGKSSYTGPKYAITLTLGICAIIFFFIGLTDAFAYAVGW